MDQQITFASLANTKQGVESFALLASTNSGMPVYFNVKEGPAEVRDGKLIFTKIPPLAKFPLKVTWLTDNTDDPLNQT